MMTTRLPRMLPRPLARITWNIPVDYTSLFYPGSDAWVAYHAELNLGDGCYDMYGDDIRTFEDISRIPRVLTRTSL